MISERERALFGPMDDSVLNQQSMHRSSMEFINRDQSQTLLATYQGSANIFWTFKIEREPTDVQLHPRVLDRLKVMGFYGPARCGPYRLDRHLITALVERWRPETHTFHFPIGEATVTLQDIAIIWGLPIEGEPIICNEPKRSFQEWREYCQQWLGFEPREWEMRNKSAILLTALSNQVKNLGVIDNDTPQEVVDQYARGCALLLLGCLMVSDSSRCSVPLVYLHFLRDVTRAGEYSWGSAVLADLYRELCSASQANKTSIAGALSLLQIWAWSRINVIQPLNVGDVLNKEHLSGANNRDLGLPPWGARWIQHHDYTRTARHAVRVYRDIFDRMTDEQFIWQPYDMRLLEISTLGPRCLTENWRSECPLINIDTVEIHHPSRVLRQFGRVQNIPINVEITHTTLHANDRKGKVGFDWLRKHDDWILHWRNKRPFEPTTLIHGCFSMTNNYMQWYNQITRRLISPNHYAAEVQGFQPPGTSGWDVLVRSFLRLKISWKRATIDNRESIEDLFNTVDQFIKEVEPILQTPPYLVDPPTPQNNEAEEATTTQRRRSSPTCRDVGASTSRSQKRHSSTVQQETFGAFTQTSHVQNDVGASTSMSQRRHSSATQQESPYTQHETFRAFTQTSHEQNGTNKYSGSSG